VGPFCDPHAGTSLSYKLKSHHISDHVSKIGSGELNINKETKLHAV